MRAPLWSERARYLWKTRSPTACARRDAAHARPRRRHRHATARKKLLCRRTWGAMTSSMFAGPDAAVRISRSHAIQCSLEPTPHEELSSARSPLRADSARQHALRFLLYCRFALLARSRRIASALATRVARAIANQIARERRRDRISADTILRRRRSQAGDDRDRCARAASVRPEAACLESAASHR